MYGTENKWGEGIDVPSADLEEIYSSSQEEMEEALEWRDAGWDWELFR
jgi:hypothetical protein